MKSINLGIYIVLLMSSVFGGSQALPYRSPAYLYNQQFCMDTVTGQNLYIGEVLTRKDHCVRVQCLETLQLWEDSCQVPKLTKGDCKPIASTEDGAEYPRCCPLYECRSYETSPGGNMEQINTYDHYGTLRSSHVSEFLVIDQRGRPKEEIPSPPARKYMV
ncbi:protein Vago [Drosophila suzukii]|uniref:Protein Vago n=1 Tax=Drosophila suzukii TaxID=28584 RepID=A0AB39YWB3_DROSZ|nr:uncharacterized protein LOC108004670 [Drosophila suzukii]